ncbi:Smoothelin-like protein 2 [Platysternon megacephalum]|uniref:Smoothelin-like protein 2 n=1 Tax=Platysternon megacephalum TaxID=55544 RepID=A0A4D9EQB0_9SAUR|nr:Smoothelin-like protein 2 [Platysternon megacephalum]
MDTVASDIADLSSQDAQSVCEALGRYEDTLRGAVREIHVDIQVFKQGVDRQVDEVLRLASPLARTVAELQQENQRLRAQVERLARQVEALSRSAGLPDSWAAECGAAGGPNSPRAGARLARFSSHATLSMTGKSQVSTAGSGDLCWGAPLGVAGHCRVLGRQGLLPPTGGTRAQEGLNQAFKIISAPLATCFEQNI